MADIKIIGHRLKHQDALVYFVDEEPDLAVVERAGFLVNVGRVADGGYKVRISKPAPVPGANVDPPALLAEHGPGVWSTRSDPYGWTGGGRALDRWAEAGVFVATDPRPRGWWLVRTDRMATERSDMLTREEKAEARFLGWYVATGDRDDTVPTDEVRRDYWLAHQDLGLPLPQAKRGRGVHALVDSSPVVVRGRGVVRGVVRADDVFSDAERMLREAGLC